MMRPLELAAFGAFGIGLRDKRVVRAAHIALGRRGFSFWNRHGGNSLLYDFERFCRRAAQEVVDNLRTLSRNQDKEALEVADAVLGPLGEQ